MTGSHQPRRPAPPTSLTSSPNVAARAQTSPTNEMAASGSSPSTVSGSTRSSSIPLSPSLSLVHVVGCSKPNRNESITNLHLDDPKDPTMVPEPGYPSV